MVISMLDQKGRCRVKGCRCDSDLIFYGACVCDKHWSRHCDKNDSFDLKRVFKVKE